MTVAADPTSAFQVSTKQYVDNVSDQLNDIYSGRFYK
jgi:hypothetical protein